MGRGLGRKKEPDLVMLKKLLDEGWSLSTAASRSGIRYGVLYNYMRDNEKFRDIVMSFYRTRHNRANTKYEFYLNKFYNDDESKIK